MKKMKKTKRILLLALVVAILACGVGGTIAYLITNTGSVVNTFQPAHVTSSVNEPEWRDGNTTKSNVTITNNGNVSAYIRAAIVITWKDVDDNTMPAQPVAGTDYTLSINAADWTQEDGYYYYKEAVAAGGTTSNLINSCSSIYTNYTDGRKLCVEVIGSAIQSEGMGVSGAQAAFAKAAAGK